MSEKKRKLEDIDEGIPKKKSKGLYIRSKPKKIVIKMVNRKKESSEGSKKSISPSQKKKKPAEEHKKKKKKEHDEEEGTEDIGSVDEYSTDGSDKGSDLEDFLTDEHESDTQSQEEALKEIRKICANLSKGKFK